MAASATRRRSRGLHPRPGLLGLRPLFLSAGAAMLRFGCSANQIIVGDVEVEEDDRFQSVRRLFEVNANFLTGQVDMDRVRGLDGGMHASGVFSNNRLYLVKNTAENEWTNLHDMLGDYINHHREYPNSLLPRFFSAFVIDGNKWVAQFNWVRSDGRVQHHRLYDLKASTCSQNANDRMIQVPIDHGIGDNSGRLPTLKDLNFVQTEEMIWLPPDQREQFVYQIRRDTNFLSQRSLMDYSMLISVLTVGQCDQAAMNEFCGQPRTDNPLYRGFFQEWQGRAASVNEAEALMHVYTFGMIDVLNEWTNTKSLAVTYRALTCGSGQVPDTVDNAAYKARFDQFFSDRTQSAQIRGLDRESECQMVRPRRLGESMPSENPDAVEDESGAPPRRLDMYTCQLNQINPTREASSTDFIVWPLTVALAIVTILALWMLFKLRQAGGVLCGDPEDREEVAKPRYKHRETELAMMYANAAQFSDEPEPFKGKGGNDFGFAPASNGGGGDFGIPGGKGGGGGGPMQFSSQMPQEHYHMGSAPPSAVPLMPSSNMDQDPNNLRPQAWPKDWGGQPGAVAERQQMGPPPGSGMPGSGMPNSGMGMPHSGMPGSNMNPSYSGGQPQWR